MVLEFCDEPAGIVQLPSRDDLDAAGSVVRDESLESLRREGGSTLVGEDTSRSGSSVKVFVKRSRASLGGAVGDRPSKASCSSN